MTLCDEILNPAYLFHNYSLKHVVYHYIGFYKNRAMVSPLSHVLNNI